MKSNKKKIVLLSIIFIIIISLVFTITKLVTATTDNTPPANETKVVVVKDENDEKLIHLRLAMKDGVNDKDTGEAASIASFQVGLNVNVDDHVGVKFDFSDEIKNQKTKRLMESNYNEEDDKLYIYYIGTEDLNDAKDPNALEIGTIKVDTDKEATINITPINKFSTAASVGHTKTEFDSVDSVEYIINRPADEAPSTEPSSDPSGEASTEPTTNPSSNPEVNVSAPPTTDNNNNNNNNNGSNNSTDGKNGWSANDTDKGNSGKKETVADRIINSFKTGANHSVGRILIILVALVLVAIIIIKKKVKMKNKNTK